MGIHTSVNDQFTEGSLGSIIVYKLSQSGMLETGDKSLTVVIVFDMAALHSMLTNWVSFQQIHAVYMNVNLLSS